MNKLLWLSVKIYLLKMHPKVKEEKVKRELVI
jgi:hypothetical protein